MTSVVEIDYTVLGYIIIGLFALVGFFRGWWKEGITTVLLVVLVVMLTQPAVVDVVIENVNKLLEFIVAIIKARGLDTEAVAAAQAAEPVVALESSNRNIYIVALIILIILSYFVGKIGLGGYAVTPLGAIMGGVLGAINGFIISSLVREYLLGRIIPGETFTAAAAAPPDTVSLQVKGLEGPALGSGVIFWIILLIGLIVLVFLISTRFQLAGGMLQGRAPAGHSSG
jgi:hypothetical protein